MAFSSYLNKTAQVWRSPGGFDAYGQQAPHAQISSVQGGLDALSGNTITQNGRTTSAADYVFMCYPADVREGDYLVIDGTRYNVVFVDDPTGRGHHLEIELKKVAV